MRRLLQFTYKSQITVEIMLRLNSQVIMQIIYSNKKFKKIIVKMILHEMNKSLLDASFRFTSIVEMFGLGTKLLT